MNFHAVVVFGLGKNLLFKSMLGRCVSVQVRVISVVEFPREGYKIRKDFGYKSISIWVHIFRY